MTTRSKELAKKKFQISILCKKFDSAKQSRTECFDPHIDGCCVCIAWCGEYTALGSRTAVSVGA